MPNIRGYQKKLNAEQIKEICGMYKDPSITRADLEDTYCLTPAELSGLLYDMGLVTPRKKTEATQQSVTLSAVEAQLIAAQKRREELDNEILRLKDTRERLSIHFEWEGDDVLVYGIGEQPFSATKQQWLAWLNHEGARALREFINAKQIH